MKLDNDTITNLLNIIDDQKNHLKMQDNTVSDLNADLDNISQPLDGCLEAIQAYQKAGDADRADWDFSDEIRQIEELFK